MNNYFLMLILLISSSSFAEINQSAVKTQVKSKEFTFKNIRAELKEVPNLFSYGIEKKEVENREQEASLKLTTKEEAELRALKDLEKTYFDDGAL